MQIAKRVGLGLIAATAIVGLAHPQDIDKSLQLYAVHVVRVPKENWTGTGVYLGNGLVLTAGHVAGSFWNTVHVQISGKDLPTEVIRRGQLSTVDLALVSIDDTQLPVSLRLRRMPVCQQGSWPGEEVIVATPDGIAKSRVIAPGLLPHDLAPKYRTAIIDVKTTGNSGSGVFDANKKCLLGIISAIIHDTKIRQENGHAVEEKTDVAKYFVPAPIIAQFIPPEYRF
jgi:hypothetical protein